jgi:hypothetical protein
VCAPFAPCRPPGDAPVRHLSSWGKVRSPPSCSRLLHECSLAGEPGIERSSSGQSVLHRDISPEVKPAHKRTCLTVCCALRHCHSRKRLRTVGPPAFGTCAGALGGPCLRLAATPLILRLIERMSASSTAYKTHITNYGCPLPDLFGPTALQGPFLLLACPASMAADPNFQV